MKKLRNTIACGVAALALLATGLTSCTGDFEIREKYGTIRKQK